MEDEKFDGFYYKQDEEHTTALLVFHEKRYVRKIMNCPKPEYIEGGFMKPITYETAMLMLKGFAAAFYIVQEVNFGETTPSEEQKRKFNFFEKHNIRMLSHKAYIDEEYRVYDIFAEKRLAYDEINEKYYDALNKCDMSLIEEFFEKNHVETSTDKGRALGLLNILKNKDSNGYSELKEKLKSDKNYVEADRLSKEMTGVFFEYLVALTAIEDHMSKEFLLFTDEYKKKLDEYADKGLFLYCLNTPDYPIDDEDITIDDVYNHLLIDDALYLKGMFETFTQYTSTSEINKREADDLIAAYHLLIEGKYWAALRNLYALIEHHHKFCSNIFNGYKDAKEKFKNGKERSEYITKLFDGAKVFYYEKIWQKVDSAIEEMNKGPNNRFVSRNSIVHGDYEIHEVNPTAKDVVNVFMVYITMRRMVDHLANIEEAVKDFELYYMGYSQLKQ